MQGRSEAEAAEAAEALAENLIIECCEELAMQFVVCGKAG